MTGVHGLLLTLGLQSSRNGLLCGAISVVGWAKRSVPNSLTSMRAMLGTLRFRASPDIAQPTQLSPVEAQPFDAAQGERDSWLIRAGSILSHP